MSVSSSEHLAEALSPLVGSVVDGPREGAVCVGRDRFDLDPEDIRRSLGQLVLTIVKLLHELLERQAVRRVDGGTLTAEEVERVGRTLQLQAREISRLAEHFGVDEKDLNMDLGPLGSLL